jgi:hypothetical protein
MEAAASGPGARDGRTNAQWTWIRWWRRMRHGPWCWRRRRAGRWSGPTARRWPRHAAMPRNAGDGEPRLPCRRALRLHPANTGAQGPSARPDRPAPQHRPRDLRARSNESRLGGLPLASSADGLPGRQELSENDRGHRRGAMHLLRAVCRHLSRKGHPHERCHDDRCEPLHWLQLVYRRMSDRGHLTVRHAATGGLVGQRPGVVAHEPRAGRGA